MTKRTKSNKRDIESYAHADKQRVNNPPVGLITPETDQDSGSKAYAYDPHLDPQPQWAGKAEHTSFEVPTVSLHVHERIDPRTIVEAVRKRNGMEAVPAPAVKPLNCRKYLMNSKLPDSASMQTGYFRHEHTYPHPAK